MAACRCANGTHRSPSTALDQPSAPIECFTGSEFRYYKLAGLHSEQENCADADDLSELRVSLKELNEQFGVDFTRQIASIDEAIADREEPEQDREAGSYRAPRQDFSHVPFSEEDARQMFQTLRSP